LGGKMSSKKYDAIWVGGGPAGRFGASFLKALGGESLIVEKQSLGGQCPRNRCAFDNYMWEQASMADQMRMFSGRAWSPKLDLSGISQAKACELFRNVGWPSSEEAMDYQTEDQLKIDVARGEGKILDKNHVEVNGKVYEGKAMVIATGSRPTIPNIPGVNLPGVMTYIEHTEMTKDPKKIVIVGAGHVGLGKAGMFRAFGTDVTVLEKEKTIMSSWDAELREYAFHMMDVRGIKRVAGVNVKEIKGHGKVEAVVAEVNGKIVEYPCDAVLLAVGLTPNSEIAKPLGVKIGRENEVVIDEGCRTSVPGVYAAGDVAGRPYLQTIARKAGMIAAKSVMGIPAKMDYEYLESHMYLTPLECTMVGLTEEEARKQTDVVTIKMPVGPKPETPIPPETFRKGTGGHGLPAYGRMFTLNFMFFGQDLHGYLKAVIDAKTRKYLGFHHIGEGAKGSFQYLSYLLKIGWTVDQMAELHEIFVNAEHFIQATRLVAGYKDITGLSRLGKAAR
jgi:pyruvate/2-oxoglutarate dehydrogenase complex dihydrolipoamide dehydrogenase (E3) component